TNGTYTFDPLPTFLGEVPVQYTISDPGGLMDNAVLTITMIPNLGNVTVANDDANSSPQGVVQTGNILTNDFDPEGNTQTVTAAQNSANAALVVNGSTANPLPSGGTLVLAANGAYTYTPAVGFVGTEIVRYTATDNGSPIATDVATLYLTTLPVNVTYAENDINQTPINIPASGNVLTNDTDPQGDNQTVTSARADTDGDGLVDDNLPLGVATTIYGLNDAGVVVVAGQVTLNVNGSYTYTPATGFTGDVPFTYTATDNNISPASDNATVTIEVIPLSTPGTNEPPVANDDTNTTEKDTNVSGNVLPNDSDPDGDPITVTSALVATGVDGIVNDLLTLGTPTTVYGKDPAGNPAIAGQLTLNPNGSYTFDPTPTFLGELPVIYKISDPAGLMDAATLTITVTENLGNATYANDDAKVGPKNVAQTGNVLTNDSDPEGNTQTVASAVNSNGTALVVNGSTANTLPSGGTLVLAANGTFTYTPATDFVGTERVQYRIVDNGSPVARDTATLYLTTLPVNCVTIETWVYLEGAAVKTDGSASYNLPMRTNLNDLGILPGQTYNDFFLGTFYTPAGQPYNGAPWNYSGTEGNGYNSNGMLPNAKANYPSTVVDWVLVSLRNNPNGTGGPICQAAALLHRDGRIEFVNQFQCCGLANQSYYLVIEHRNHLIVMSHQPVAIVDGKISYDFRTQQSYISDPFGFGTFSGQKQIQPGNYAMLAGNGNQTLTNRSDTDINFDDRTFWEILNGTIARYRSSDYNLNGDTNFNDRRAWEFNNGKFTSVPRN
uniref:Ig-like domain-containing protein n=1 Tax=Haliscomenobacter sp. TaxID=2717303 RepID=UPI0035943CA9